MTVTRRQRRILGAVIPAALFVGVIVLVTVNPFSSTRRAYRPDEANPDITRNLDIDAPESAPPVTFVDCTADAGIDFVHFRGGTRTSRLPEDMGPGAAWGDFDDDGDDDLYFVDLAFTLPDMGSAPAPGRGNRLYENLGNGTFRDITERSGTGAVMIGLGAAWGDLDGDGRLDLLTTGYRAIRVYHNRGDGTFADVSEACGFEPDGFWSGIALGDYDLDDDLDVYVCGYVDYDDAKADEIRELTMQYRLSVPFSLNPSSFDDSANRLYRNDGAFAFTEVAAAAGVDGRVDGRVSGKSLGALWLDVNEDSWPDLYVANDVSNNHLFLNNHDGTFREDAATAWLADPRGAMGLAVGDFDNDLDPDLFISHWIAQENALYVNLARETARASASDSTAEGQSVFSDRADLLGLGQTALDYVGWGSNFFDFDRDGFLDLFIANGSTFEDESDRTHLVAMPSILFRNLGMREVVVGGETKRLPVGFLDSEGYAGPFFRESHVARGSSVSDFDDDGDLDLLVCLFGEAPRLLRNDDDTGHHWVKLRLRGRGGNRFAIGARLWVHTPDFDRVEHVGANPSYLSGSVTDTHVGLGAYSGPITVEVEWPGGDRETFPIERTDTTVWIDQGEGRAVEVERAPAFPTPTGPRGAHGDRLSGEAYLAFQRMFREGTRHRIAAELEEAEARYRQALELDPRHTDALFYLGTVLFDRARYTEAVEVWYRMMAIEEKSSKGNFMLGVAHACPLEDAPTDFDTARQHFDRAFQANKEESGALLRMAELSIVEGDLARAREQLQAAVGSYFSAVDGHYLLSYVLWSDGERAKATESMRRAVEYAGSQGMAGKTLDGVLGEGDIADPSVLRMVEQYRVRPLVHHCVGLVGRAAVGVDERFCEEEFESLDRTLQTLRAR